MVYSTRSFFIRHNIMAENQNPHQPSTQSMPVASTPAVKKTKINPVVPVVIVFLAIAAFLAVWYLAVK